MYRNGVVADVLRRSGMPYEVIFGVDVPSLASIAREIGHDNELAQKLWKDKNVRESRLLATYLFDEQTLAIEEAAELCGEVLTPEEADMLYFRLLRHLPYLSDLYHVLESHAGNNRIMTVFKKHLDCYGS